MYQGSVQDGMPHGVGVWTSLEGETYDGGDLNRVKKKRNLFSHVWHKEWKWGKRHGRGKCSWNDNESYNGDWDQDVMQGQGTYTFSNGDTYVGQYVKVWRVFVCLYDSDVFCRARERLLVPE
jgi:hypothetical protein